jgi:hypothetical protein
MKYRGAARHMQCSIMCVYSDALNPSQTKETPIPFISEKMEDWTLNQSSENFVRGPLLRTEIEQKRYFFGEERPWSRLGYILISVF